MYDYLRIQTTAEGILLIMNTNYTIHAILPFYNTPVDRLDKCISSVLTQTHKNFKLYIIDDGSNQFCAGYLDKYLTLDSRILVLHKENGGVSSARNYGMQILSERLTDIDHYQLLTFIDSDDYLEPNAWETAISHLDRTNSDAVVFSWTDVSPNQENIPHYVTAEHSCSTHSKFLQMMEEIAKGNMADFKTDHPKELTFSGRNFVKEISSDNIYCGGGYPWNKIWRILSIATPDLKLPIYDETLHIYEDKLWCIQAASHCNNISVISDKLYNYVYFSDSITRQDNEVIDRQPAAYAAFDRILDYLQTYDMECYQAAYNFFFDVIYDDIAILTDDKHKASHKQQYKSTMATYRRLCKRIKPRTLLYPVKSPQFRSWALHHFL